MNPAETPVLIAQNNIPANPGLSRFKPRLSLAGVFLLAVAQWVAPALHSQTYTFSTLAGIGGKAGSLEGTGGGIGFPLFSGPSGLVINKAGNLYVTDSSNQLIREVTPAGAVTTWAGTVGQAGVADGTGISASFNSPQGPAVDSAGNLYIADFNSATVRKITPAGVVTTLAGLAVTPGSVDGTGSVARFLQPSGVAVDASNNVYVTDSGNHTIRKITSAGVVTTFAGTAGVSGSTDATGAAARFSKPRGIAIDSTGNLYVADTNNNAIRKITSAGVVTTLAGKAGTFGGTDGDGAAARFNFPNALTVDGSGNLYVADELNHTIRKVTAAGSVVTLAGTAGTAGKIDGAGSAARFNHPSGIAVDASGNIYVADYNNELIRKVSSAGVVTTVSGVAAMAGALDGLGYNLTPALFSSPSSTAVDAQGNVYVADTGNNTIRRITSAGVVSTLAGSSNSTGRVNGIGAAASFNSPSGLATDAAGNIYVADTVNHLIRLVTPAGVVSTFAGTGGSAGSADGIGTAASFELPSAVTVDAQGNVYVADYDNSTIRKITPAGQVTTLAGTAGTVGGADGLGSAARFNHPKGLAVDAGGNIYVADFGNHTIRKISPGGLVLTLAGTAGSAGSADGSGSIARFNGPSGIALDGAGNLYVVDTNNSTIRLVTSAGVVTTLGGVAGTASNVDGVSTAARFDHPAGLASDTLGNLYIADTRNHTIRKGTTPASGGGGGGGSGGSGGGSDTGGTGGSGGSGGTGGNGGTGGSGGSGSVGTGFVLRPAGLILGASGSYYVADTANNSIKAIASDGTITVFAGKVGSAGSADGTGTSASFNGPTGLVGDSAGNIYVCDTGNATIRKITSGGVVTTVAGSVGSRGTQDGTGSAALFSTPTGIALDSAGNLFVSDSANSTIRKITSAGVVTTFAGVARSTGDVDGIGTAARFNNPTGLSMGVSNFLYVADTYNSTIRLINTSATSARATAAGTIVTAGNATVTITESGLTGSPVTVSVAVLADDTPTAWAAKVVTAIQANTVLAARYSVSSSGTAIFLTRLAVEPTDATLNIALADGTSVGVVAAPTSVVSLSGNVTTLAGSAGVSGAYDGTGAFALFNLPNGLSVDGSSTVYVADTGNNCIRRITAGGAVTTIAGIAGITGSRDGTSTSALFNQPQALVAGTLIVVADTGNSIIRTINSQAVVSTLALKAPSTGDSGSGGGSSGGGNMNPGFVAALLVLSGFAWKRRNEMQRV